MSKRKKMRKKCKLNIKVIKDVNKQSDMKENTTCKKTIMHTHKTTE